MSDLITIIEETASAFYVGEDQQGLDLFLGNAANMAVIPGIADWLNPLFDVVEQQDYLYAADILLYEVIPLAKTVG